MLVDDVCVYFGEEDFSHVSKAFRKDFSSLALFVGMIQCLYLST